jgi:sugar phosphate isomerase/epimerase
VPKGPASPDDRRALPPARLACSSICFRQSPLAEALHEIASAGFTAVDLALVPGFCEHGASVLPGGVAEHERVRELIDRYGLEVPVITTVPGHFNGVRARFDEIVAQGRATIRLAAQLGCRAINLHCGLPLDDHGQFRVEAKTQATGLRELARAAAEHGLAANIEAPHRNGLCRTIEEAEWLMDRIAEPNVRFLLDVSHVQAAGRRPEQIVERWAGRIGHVHLRDGLGDDVFRVPGEGSVDFAAVFAALDRTGYADVCALELEGHGETLTERRRGVARAVEILATCATLEGVARPVAWS